MVIDPKSCVDARTGTHATACVKVEEIEAGCANSRVGEAETAPRRIGNRNGSGAFRDRCAVREVARRDPGEVAPARSERVLEDGGERGGSDDALLGLRLERRGRRRIASGDEDEKNTANETANYHEHPFPAPRIWRWTMAMRLANRKSNSCKRKR